MVRATYRSYSSQMSTVAFTSVGDVEAMFDNELCSSTPAGCQASETTQDSLSSRCSYLEDDDGDVIHSTDEA